MSIVPTARQSTLKNSPGALRLALSGVKQKLALAGVDALVRLFKLPLGVLPLTAQARLRQTWKPVACLDYRRHEILLNVESELDLYRARACWKEPETVRWLEESLAPGAVLYDIGANVGAYAMIASKFCRNQVTVHAFEPSFATYSQLCRNVILNRCQGSIMPHMLCLTDATKPVVFGYGSLTAGSALHTVRNAADARADEFKAVYEQQMLGFSIDDLVSRFGFPIPNHIKLDVDGAELDVLRGAVQTLSDPRVTSLLVEVGTGARRADAVLELLRSLGFEPIARSDRGDATTWNLILQRVGRGRD